MAIKLFKKPKSITSLKKLLKKVRIEEREWFDKKFTAYLYPLFALAEGIVPWMNYRFGDGFKIAFCFIKNNHFIWFWLVDDMVRLRRKIIRKNLADPGFINKFLNTWKRDYQKFISLIEKANHLSLESLNDKQLFSLHQRIYRAFNWQLSLAQLTDSFLNAGSEDWFFLELSKFWQNKRLKESLEKAFQTLSLPLHHSFANREKIDLLTLAVAIKKKKELIKIFKKKSPKEIKENLGSFPKISAQLKRQVKNFYWIENNYFRAKYLKEDYFIKKIKKLLSKRGLETELRQLKSEIEVIKSKKAKLIKKIKLSRELRNIIKLIEEFTILHDTRKSTVFRVNYFYFRFLDEVAKRKNIPPEEIYFSIPPEIEDILLNNKYNHEVLRERGKGVSFVYTTKEFYVLTDKENNYYKLKDFLGANQEKNIIKGSVSYPGFVKGRVKVISGNRDFKKMKKGDILITNNTTPEFTSVIKLASAIVTEQGGVTTHAAIISRELKIPCVIGTKIATLVFKDGDKVEVDAMKGIIRKI